MIRRRHRAPALAPRRPALLLACVAAHAALIAAFWSARPMRAPTPVVPALLQTPPGAGAITRVDGAGHPERAARPRRPAAMAHRDGAPPTPRVPALPVPARRGLDLGTAAIVSLVPAAAAAAPSPTEAEPFPWPPGAGEPVADAAPPAARSLPPPPRATDPRLEYHRMRAAQETLRFHDGRGAHLAWLRDRVAALLARAAGPGAPAGGTRCTARLDAQDVALACDDTALAERLRHGGDDLAVLLGKLITLTAPGGELEIAFPGEHPPAVRVL